LIDAVDRRGNVNRTGSIPDTSVAVRETIRAMLQSRSCKCVCQGAKWRVKHQWMPRWRLEAVVLLDDESDREIGRTIMYLIMVLASVSQRTPPAPRLRKTTLYRVSAN
jgi:hypothetical protein